MTPPSIAPIGTYSVRLPVPPPYDMQGELNRAWGFANGQCNVLRGEVFKPRKGADDPAFIEAHHRLGRFAEVPITVTVYSDGSKSFEIEQPNKKDINMATKKAPKAATPKAATPKTTKKAAATLKAAPAPVKKAPAKKAPAKKKTGKAA